MFDLNKKEKPFTSFGGFGGGGLGLAGGAISAKTYVDDVFSTFLYEGNGGTQSINNGIDLSGEGGLVWFKKRNAATYGGLWDTERGVTKRLRSDDTIAEASASNLVTSFNSNGVSISDTGGTQINNNNDDYVSWTFRKAPGFFDVVTYTGNATSGRTIAHNLGSVPGMILVKATGIDEAWVVYHRSQGATKYAAINSTTQFQTNSSRWNDTEPTSTVFTVGSDVSTNGAGGAYVAYIFAHDDAQFGTGGDESIIKCGTYTGNGNANNVVNIGFEPQWLLVKAFDANYGWVMLDNMRGIVAGSGDDRFLSANSSNEEQGQDMLDLTSTGFIAKLNSNTNASGKNYIYMAIRRPHKPPEVGTDVFNVITTTSANDYWTTGFAPDMLLTTQYQAATDKYISARSNGNGNTLRTNTNANEVVTTTDYFFWDSPTGQMKQQWWNSGGPFLHYTFKRAPSFFDIVNYSGTGANRTVSHNLGAVPEMMWVKKRNYGGESWSCYHKDLGATKVVWLNDSGGGIPSSARWNDTAPTSSVFSLGTDASVNKYDGSDYVAHLFATVPGVSKVGSYTGTGNAINVDCGFTNGARFVLIKRIGGEGDWAVWDTARGISSGNDPFIRLNVSNSQNTNNDWIDPLSSGFTVTSSGTDETNGNGSTYIFLAIA